MHMQIEEVHGIKPQVAFDKLMYVLLQSCESEELLDQESFRALGLYYYLYSWLKANKLSLNIAKTEFMVISSRQKFLAENCSELNIQLDNQPISRVEHAKSLGLIIDD